MKHGAFYPERSGPRRRRRVPYIQNPVGEAIGPWDDSSGSAAEDEEYERDNFVVSDDDEAEFGEEDLSDSSETLPDQSGSDNDDSDARDSNDSSGSSVDLTHCEADTQAQANMIVSDGEEDEEAGPSARKPGKKYRLQRESSEERFFR